MINKTDQIPYEIRLTLLKKIQLFSDLHRPSLKKIADLLEEMEFQKGHYIFRKGEEGDAVYIIAKGSVSVKDEEFILSTLNEGDVFGEYSLIDNKSRSASILTNEVVRVLRLSRVNFSRLMTGNTEILQGLLRMFVKRLRTQDTLEKQLSDQNRQILIQKKELEELNEEKNNIVAVVAHDLRNPLSSTLSLAELLKSESEDFTEDQVICIDGIIKALNRLHHMVNRILDVRALEDKQPNLQLEKINLSKICEQVYLSFSEKFEKKNLNPILNLNVVHAQVDKHYLLQILENLISNAIKYSPAGKNIFINTWSHNGNVYIGVKDEGPGISVEDQAKLFRRYQSLGHQTTGGETSTGIGLFIVKKYTEMMKGEIWCESEPGKGAKFVISFKKL